MIFNRCITSYHMETPVFHLFSFLAIRYSWASRVFSSKFIWLKWFEDGVNDRSQRHCHLLAQGEGKTEAGLHTLRRNLSPGWVNRPHLPIWESQNPAFWMSVQSSKLEHCGRKKQTSKRTVSYCSNLLKLWTVFHWKRGLVFCSKGQHVLGLTVTYKGKYQWTWVHRKIYVWETGTAWGPHLRFADVLHIISFLCVVKMKKMFRS